MLYSTSRRTFYYVHFFHMMCYCISISMRFVQDDVMIFFRLENLQTLSDFFISLFIFCTSSSFFKRYFVRWINWALHLFQLSDYYRGKEAKEVMTHQPLIFFQSRLARRSIFNRTFISLVSQKVSLDQSLTVSLQHLTWHNLISCSNSAEVSQTFNTV